LRIQVRVPRVQVHPVPLIAVAVSPEGNVSTTVTVPDVGPDPPLLTVRVYVAPVWPCVKLPLCVFVRVRSGRRGAEDVTVVASEAVLLAVFASPPPETVAVLVTPDGALVATVTVTVMAG
jgi:hypothetical protein